MNLNQAKLNRGALLFVLMFLSFQLGAVKQKGTLVVPPQKELQTQDLKKLNRGLTLKQKAGLFLIKN